MGSHRQAERGFTLGELLTTLAVVGISTALVVPSFDTVMSNNRRAAGVNQLVSTMHVARSEAITRNTQVTLCPSSDGQSCTAGTDWNDGWIYFADEDRDETVDAGEVVLGGGPGMGGRLDVQSTEFADYLAYRPNGRVLGSASAATNSGQFNFCDHRGEDFARVLLINTTGEPRLAGEGEAVDPDCPEES